MPKLEGVIRLTVRARHLCHLQGSFAGDTVKRALSQEHVIREGVLLDEFLHALGKRSDHGSAMDGHAVQRRGKSRIARKSRRKVLQREQHRRKGTRHHRTLFIRRTHGKTQIGSLFEGGAGRASDPQCRNLEFFAKQIAREQRLGVPPGAGNDHSLQTGGAEQRGIGKQHHLGGRQSEGPLTGLETPGRRRHFGQVVAGSAADEQPCRPPACLLQDGFDHGAAVAILQRFLPSLGLRHDFVQRGGVAELWLRAVHRSTVLVLGRQISTAFVRLRISSFYYDSSVPDFLSASNTLAPPREPLFTAVLLPASPASALERPTVLFVPEPPRGSSPRRRRLPIWLFLPGAICGRWPGQIPPPWHRRCRRPSALPPPAGGRSIRVGLVPGTTATHPCLGSAPRSRLPERKTATSPFSRCVNR